MSDSSAFPARPGKAPQISVIVPTYQRPGTLRACLKALAESDGVTFEVVVVDDGSDPPAEAAALGVAGLPMRYQRQENAGPASARNRGARLAKAPLLAFTDDDCRPDPGWLAAMVSALEKAPDALVGGRTVNALAGDVYAEASQDLIGFLHERGGADAGYFASNNIACSKADFEAMGGFDERFPLAAGEDRDLGLRWGRSGRPLVLEPRALMHHHHALSLRRFWRQHSNYGRGAAHLRGLGEEGGGHSFSGPSFYARLVTYPLRAGGKKALRRSALLGLAQAATAWGFFRQSRAR
ncbi:glycosyltransferase family 2 protein [Parvularcula oceani]|uniref:glycosyltransferase family 2 protein n=1 Tax=Parvularcula oceani TaxID=1247963 RepID=UPI00068F1081|nr:glycosyltransferase [Parvularcula oceani]